MFWGAVSTVRRAWLLPILVVAGCAGSPQPRTVPTAERDVEMLRWPPAPAEARIVWEGSFQLPADLGLRTSFWVRAKRFLLGDEGDHLKQPQGLCFVAGRLLVTDPARARVLICDIKEEKFQAVEANTRRPWMQPISVAGFANGVLFVADARGSLFRLTPPYADAVAQEWAPLVRPVAVAVDALADRVYVADVGCHGIHVGTAAGVYLWTIGSHGGLPGQFNFPTHLTVTGDGSLLVTDAMNFRVQHLMPDGRVVAVFGQAGDGTGHFAKPKGIAIDGAQTIYVVDALHSVVQMFDETGRFLMHFGAPGQQAGEFWLPTGIAIDPSGRIYVADSYNQRVQIFSRVDAEEVLS